MRNLGKVYKPNYKTAQQALKLEKYDPMALALEILSKRESFFYTHPRTFPAFIALYYQEDKELILGVDPIKSIFPNPDDKIVTSPSIIDSLVELYGNNAHVTTIIPSFYYEFPRENLTIYVKNPSDVVYISTPYCKWICLPDSLVAYSYSTTPDFTLLKEIVKTDFWLDLFAKMNL